MAPALPQLQPQIRPRLAVVGNGMAAIRTIEELLARQPGRYDITVFGAEPHGSYNRILLSSVLAGDMEMQAIVTHPRDWYEANGITLHTGDPVVALDLDSHTLTTAGGRSEGWDRLILATGAAPILPAIPGMGLDGICTFRSMADVEHMLNQSRHHARAVVIGGGVLGLEAAWGLKRQGMEVTVVHLAPHLMERQLDGIAGEMLARELAERGIACVTGAQAVAVIGEGRVWGVRLSDGGEIPADLVVAAMGIAPRADLARQAGLAVGRGVLVGDDMRSSHPDVFAVGECVEHDGRCYGLVAPLWDMAKVCAGLLADQDSPLRFAPPPVATKLKIPGIDLLSAGAIEAANDDEREIVQHKDGSYRKLVLRRDRLVGVVLYGDLAGATRLFQWIEDGTGVDEQVLGGQALGGLGDDVSALPDDSMVCHCHNVTKGMLRAALVENPGLEQVCRATRAGSGCGQCRTLVAGIVAHELGQQADLEAVARRTARMGLGFKLWHRTNAVLMIALLVTGLALHFPGLPPGFEISHLVHSYAGYALCAAFAAYLALCTMFDRKNRADVQGLTMMVTMPLVVATGLAFLFPGLLPARLLGFSGIVPVALAHLLVTVLVLMFLIHHLSHAPFVWWQKRKARCCSREGS